MILETANIGRVTMGSGDDEPYPGRPEDLDRDGRTALYVQVADILHAQIDGGAIEGRLPSMEAIADRYKVARNTAASALRLLRREDVITFSPGLGYYTLPPPHPNDSRG